MSDSDSIKQDVINDLLAQDAERRGLEWDTCVGCEGPCDPDTVATCEECGGALCADCAVPHPEDESCAICEECLKLWVADGGK